MPLPRIDSPPPAWTSPVATQTVSGWSRQVLIPAIDWDASSVHDGSHVSPPSTDLKTPPEAAPAYMIVGSVGWIASARTRPVMLRGPVGIQLPRVPTST